MRKRSLISKTNTNLLNSNPGKSPNVNIIENTVDANGQRREKKSVWKTTEDGGRREGIFGDVVGLVRRKLTRVVGEV